MLVRDKDSQEGYKHICDDSYKYTKQALKERMQIYLTAQFKNGIYGGG